MNMLADIFHQSAVIHICQLVIYERWKLPEYADIKTGNLKADEGTENTKRTKCTSTVQEPL